MTIESGTTVEEDARIAAGLYDSANAETKMAYLREIASQLGMASSLEGSSPKLQAAILDEIKNNVGDRPLMARVAFTRGVIDALDLNARLITQGERLRRQPSSKQDSLILA